MNAIAQLLPRVSPFELKIQGCSQELRVVSFDAVEEMSNLFEVQLELATDGPELGLGELLRKPALLTMAGFVEPRYIHGIVTELEHLHDLPRYTLYRITIVPEVWQLRHHHDCRIFQTLSTPEIIQKVLKDTGIPEEGYELRLTGSYEPRDYCVQYRESSWAFLSRLMEEDGIFYYFEHSEDGHLLVFQDQSSGCKPISGEDSLSFRPPSGLDPSTDHVHRFRLGEQVKPGRVFLRDFNFKQPALKTEGEAQEKTDKDLEVYDYPGEFQLPGSGSSAKGGGIARIRLEQWQVARREGRGESECQRLLPGQIFSLTDHPRAELNRKYLLTRVNHHGQQPQSLDEEAAEGESRYQNSFHCIEDSVPFRALARTPKPLMRGIQTAIVVGPEGEEIYTDEFGRVKVQFHWDREGKFDDKSSCWIRVSQAWAGQAWGGICIPRIGQEVIVDFVEGDPDRPLITGRVYNGTNLTPYVLPDEKTKSTLKSSSSPGGEGFNELRIEDRKGQEQVFVHAERNMDVHVKHDSMEVILHDRHQTIGASGEDGKVGDQNELVYRDKSLQVHRHHHEQIGGNQWLHVGGIDGDGNSDMLVEGRRRELIRKDQHLHVQGNRLEKVDQTHSSIVKSFHHKVSELHAVDAGAEIHLKAPKIVLQATQGLTIQAPGGFITIDASGISIQGTLVKINSGGSALSGSGVSPISPEDADPASPVKPTPADHGGSR